jgi:hypothetical protein
MKVSGLTLETIYFEDYLAFLTEVLELELDDLTETSMRLVFDSTWFEIKKVSEAPLQVATSVEFSLSEDEYQALAQKVSFFYYRRGPTRFLYLGTDSLECRVVDPDGRTWRFVPFINSLSFSSSYSL